MTWRTRSAPKTFRMTRKLAEEFQAMEPAPQDRAISERRMVIYERILRAGHFRPLEWSRAYCKETDGVYRVNGKHTATLIAGLETVPELYVTIYDYECDTLDDVAKLYATFDSRLGARNTTDINLAFAGAIPALRPLPARTINALVSGIPYFQKQDGISKIPPAERAEVLLDEQGFCLFVHELTSIDKDAATVLARVPVIAAIYGSYKRDQHDCKQFWEAVRDETGPTPELPDRKLAKYLATCSIRVSKSSRRVIRSDSREIFVKCLHAWNAWRKEESTNLNYRKDKPIPELA